jgi:hypothetical protein
MAEALIATYEANTAVHDISGTPTLRHQRRDAPAT